MHLYKRGFVVYIVDGKRITGRGNAVEDLQILHSILYFQMLSREALAYP